MEDITTDPYNWPFPKRHDLMSLQTINQRDVGFPKHEIKDVRSRNFDLSDIKGTTPQMPGYKYNQKETFINRNDDIEGTSSKQLIKTNINKPDYALSNLDISGTKPQMKVLQTTRAPLNPLTPEYILPKAEIRIASPPKFIRDSFQIDDIKGTKPNPNCFRTRNVDIYTEIEGSKTRKPFIPQVLIESLNVKDINGTKFKTTRHTNPLTPFYHTSDENGNQIEYGNIHGSTSRRLHPKQSTKINLNLTTNDIKGAWHDTQTEKFLMRNTRKDFRHSNLNHDLPETQVGSLKRGISTSRQTNPLTPIYQELGRLEITEGLLHAGEKRNTESFHLPAPSNLPIRSNHRTENDANRITDNLENANISVSQIIESQDKTQSLEKQLDFKYISCTKIWDQNKKGFQIEDKVVQNNQQN